MTVGENAVKAGGQMRSKATVKRLQMYALKAPNSRQLHSREKKPMRVEPDRRWFGNTRVITQGKMADFRDALSKDLNDPFKVALKASKLPMTLLKDSEKQEGMDLLKVESFKETFGGKSQRKRPKLQELKPNTVRDNSGIVTNRN